MPEVPSKEFIDLQEAVAGRYSLEREIGRGGMGIVFLARDVTLDRPVALKLLPPALAAESNLRERFVREARTSAKLSHPNVIPIYSVDEAGEFVFFTMSYIEGETLGRRIRERGPLPPHEAARILREVAWALAYSHAQGVVHRDVKPENILLEKETDRILVADFGIARVGDGSGLTGIGEVLGTAEYMSPEQASGQGVDARSDIYSLGIVGFYALSGRLPFEGSTVVEILAKHLNQPPPPLATVAPGLPPKLCQVIDRCLVKEPSGRHESSEALADAVANTVERRKEMPVALRVFLKKAGEQSTATKYAAVLTAPFFLFPAIGLLFEGEFVIAFTVGAAWLGLITGLPSLSLVRNARRLMRSGYTLPDLEIALQRDLDARQEEMLFEYGGKPPLFERAAGKYAIGAFALTGLAGITLILAPDSDALAVAEAFAWFFGMTGVLAGLLKANRYAQRTQLGRRIRNKLLGGRLGRWLFKIAGIGIKKPALAAEATYRPTEIAIGLAADQLFKELPKEIRRAMADLPDVVRRLEADAQTMRHRIGELDDMLAEVAGSEQVAGSKSEEREQLVSNLRSAREAAEGRLREAVATLESIRLDLLRMRSGAGSIESITADLASARELQEGIERLIQGQKEVEKLLRDRPSGRVSRTSGVVEWR